MNIASFCKKAALGLLLLPGISQAANIGYMDMCGGNQAAHATAITTAGHTPIAITTPDAASLAGLATLSVTNCDNGGFSTLYTDNLAAITAAVNGGMVLFVHDRAVTNAGSILPGGSGILTTRDFNDDANIDFPVGSPIINGPGGTLNNSSLDGGNSSSHGFVDPASLPLGGSVLAHRAAASEGVTVLYPYGSGQVVYSTIPLDYYLAGNGPNPPRDNFNQIYLPNLLTAVVGQGATCASEGYTGTKLRWCKEICENGNTGATLDTWIHRWISKFRDLPYCAVEGGEEPQDPPQGT